MEEELEEVLIRMEQESLMREERKGRGFHRNYQYLKGIL